jgi:hypothetical protein
MAQAEGHTVLQGASMQNWCKDGELVVGLFVHCHVVRVADAPASWIVDS